MSMDFVGNYRRTANYHESGEHSLDMQRLFHLTEQLVCTSQGPSFSDPSFFLCCIG